jgi:beta-galactosidase
VSDNLVHFTVSGAAGIEAADNSTATTVEPFHADHRKGGFNGLALLIVRSLPGQSGKIQIVATSQDWFKAKQKLVAQKIQDSQNKEFTRSLQ